MGEEANNIVQVQINHLQTQLRVVNNNLEKVTKEVETLKAGAVFLWKSFSPGLSFNVLASIFTQKTIGEGFKKEYEKRWKAYENEILKYNANMATGIKERANKTEQKNSAGGDNDKDVKMNIEEGKGSSKAGARIEAGGDPTLICNSMERGVNWLIVNEFPARVGKMGGDAIVCRRLCRGHAEKIHRFHRGGVSGVGRG